MHSDNRTTLTTQPNARTCSIPRLLIAGALLVASGCQDISLSPINEIQLRDKALTGLKNGARYRPNPLIRAQAIEALSETAPSHGRIFFRQALRDLAPGVRFAASMALGMIRDTGAAEMLRSRLGDDDPSVRAAVVFALHRLGEQSYTSVLADNLLRDPSVEVRRNTALILGRLGEPGSIRLLRHAARDKDESVVLQAHEAMALLKDPKALQQLAVQAHDGAGHRQAMALLAMGRTGNHRFLDVLRLRLNKGPYLETRLAAARALGQLGYPDGLQIALKAADFNPPRPSPADNDSPENRLRRIRTMAVLALGAIGDRAGLPILKKRLDDQSDPRLQIAAAKAILEILNQGLPWNHSPPETHDP